MKRLILGLGLALFTTAALAQTLPLGSVATGRGAGVSGLNGVAPGVAGLPLVSNGPLTQPSFQGIPPNVGAACNGVTDDTATIQAALTAITAGNYGAAVLPKGVCIISSALVITPNSCTALRGQGPEVTVIRQTSGTAKGITYLNSTLTNCGSITDLSINAGTGTATGSTGTGIDLLRVGDNFSVSNIAIKWFATGLQFDSSWNTRNNNGVILGCQTACLQIAVPTGTPGGGNTFTSWKISNNGFTGSNASSIGIRVRQSGGQFWSIIDVTSFNQGIVIDPPAAVFVLYDTWNTVYADTNVADGWTFDGTASTVGGILCTDCWAGFNGGNGFVFKGASLTTVSLNGIRARESGLSGVKIDGGTNLRFGPGGQIGCNSTAVSLAKYGFEIAADVSSFSIQGSAIGNNLCSSPTQGEGIVINAGASNDYIITGNDLSNAGAGKTPIVNLGTGLRVQIHDNLPLTEITDGIVPTTLTAAATVALGQTGSHMVVMNGNTGINSFGTFGPLDVLYRIRYTGTPLITAGANLIITPTNGGNLQVEVGDVSYVQYEGSSVWRIVEHVRASGQPIITTNVTHGGTGLTSGTSGGIPYFNSASTMASSAVLDAARVIVGGGVGVAPSTVPCTISSSPAALCFSTTTFSPSWTLQNVINDAGYAAFNFQKSRAAIVQSGDGLGANAYFGFNGTSYDAAAQILAEVDGTPGASNDMPGRIIFKTTPDGSATLAEAFRINSKKHLKASGTAPALSSCGTTPAITGNDTHGTVTMGTGSPVGCVITFNQQYTSAPDCIVTWQANLASMQYVISTTAITLTQTATSSNKVNYQCFGT